MGDLLEGLMLRALEAKAVPVREGLEARLDSILAAREADGFSV
jgi:hypothetical protein